MRFRVLLIILISVTVASCGTVIMPFVVGPRPKNVTNKSIVSNAVAVFQEYGFPPAMVESDIGIVITDWTVLTNIGSEVAAAIITEALLGTAETYRQRMKLTLTVDETKNTFTIRPMKQQLTTLYGWSAQGLNDTDMQRLENIATDITARLGGAKGKLKWKNLPQTSYAQKAQASSQKTAESEFDGGTELVLVMVGTVVLIITLMFSE